MNHNNGSYVVGMKKVMGASHEVKSAAIIFLDDDGAVLVG